MAQLLCCYVLPDHKPYNLAERARIERFGGSVRAPTGAQVPTPTSFCCFGPPQVNPQALSALRLWPGGFSVSRALGDIDYKLVRRGKVPSPEILSSTPDIKVFARARGESHAVLCADRSCAVWCVLSRFC
jgi:hypothetical protein